MASKQSAGKIVLIFFSQPKNERNEWEKVNSYQLIEFWNQKLYACALLRARSLDRKLSCTVLRPKAIHSSTG